MARRRPGLALALALALLVAAPAARADLVHLNTGGVVKGDIIAETAEEVTIKTAAGIQTIFREDIERIERGQSGESLYKEGLAKLAPSDAEGHYRLGKELKKLRMDKEARECFERALKADPNLLPARIALAEETARAEALVAETEDERTAEPAPAAARAKLTPDIWKALEAAKKEGRSGDLERRKASWEKVLAIHAGQETPEGKEAVLASVAALESRERRLYERNAKRLARAIPDYERESARSARDRYREAWERAARAALEVIFDLKVYPDENHGRAGQKFVDEKVDVVKAKWPAYDQLVTHDLSRFAAMSEEQAKVFAGVLEGSRAVLAEALAALETMGAQALKPLPAPPPPVHRALLLYRAGRVEEAWAAALDPEEKDLLTPWERRLLERMRDLRVEAYNDRVLAEKSPPRAGKRPANEERKQVLVTNQYRMLMGRPALEIHPCLVESARGHSKEMTDLGYFAHESPLPQNREPSDRAKNAGYAHGVAENISLGSPTAQATHDSWYNSSPHHRNILGEEHRAMGSGLDGQHWTQNFGSYGDLIR